MNKFLNTLKNQGALLKYKIYLHAAHKAYPLKKQDYITGSNGYYDTPGLKSESKDAFVFYNLLKPLLIWEIKDKNVEAQSFDFFDKIAAGMLLKNPDSDLEINQDFIDLIELEIRAKKWFGFDHEKQLIEQFNQYQNRYSLLIQSIVHLGNESAKPIEKALLNLSFILFTKTILNYEDASYLQNPNRPLISDNCVYLAYKFFYEPLAQHNITFEKFLKHYQANLEQNKKSFLDYVNNYTNKKINAEPDFFMSTLYFSSISDEKYETKFVDIKSQQELLDKVVSFERSLFEKKQISQILDKPHSQPDIAPKLIAKKHKI